MLNFIKKLFQKEQSKKPQSFDAVLADQKIEAELDPSSSTWKFIVNYSENRLQKLREKNDSIILDERKTAILRGRIKENKLLLELPEKEG